VRTLTGTSGSESANAYIEPVSYWRTLYRLNTVQWAQEVIKQEGLQNFIVNWPRYAPPKTCAKFGGRYNNEYTLALFVFEDQRVELSIKGEVVKRFGEN